MTLDQEAFVQMLEDKGLIPNLSMKNNGKDWTDIVIDLMRGSRVVTLTFNPDGKLIEVDADG